MKKEKIIDFFKKKESLELLELTNDRIKYKCLVCSSIHDKKLSSFLVRKRCTMTCANLKRKQTNLEKYGVENVSKSNLIKKKKEDTCLKNYGVKSPLQNKEIQEKVKQTCIEKYGVENPQQNKEIQEKTQQTCLKKYGTNISLKSEIIKEKIKQTNLEKYGVENVSQSDLIKKKKENTFLERYGFINSSLNKEIQEKTQQTCLKKYGAKSPFESNIVQEKIKQVCLEKYGVEFPLLNEKIKEKTSLKRKSNYYNNKILNFTHCKPLFTLEEYNGIENKIYKWKCNKCYNEFEDHMEDGHIPICLICYPKNYNISKLEQELKDWLINYIKFEPNKRFYFNNKFYELDIYIDELKLGIEFDGLYWHSDSAHNDKYNLYNKTKFFNSIGINIIHIFENEWVYKQEIVKSIILNKIGLTSNKIYARKCIIKEANNNDSNLFLNNNHIQGNVNSSIKLGLYYENQLVSLLTLGKSRFNKKYDYEILRFCNKLNTNVIGSFSKLLNYFKNNYEFNNLITYADKRYSNGNLYYTNGFKLINESKPDYFYIKGIKFYHRSKFQKHKLINLLENFNPNLTEYENMIINGYKRIFDCGNYVFGIKKEEF